MNTYFIHQEGQSLGPFSIGELRQRKITPNTPVWSEGMDSWVSAKEVAELQFLFRSTPPPLIKPQTLPEPEEKVLPESQEPKGKKKSYGWVYVLFVIIVCSSIAVFTFQQIRINELETELTEQTDSLKDIRRVSDSRQTEIDEMKQEELMRQKEENRISLTKQLAELNTQLDAEKAKLEKINEFQLFRSSEDKVQQVTAQQDVVNSLEQKIEALKKEQQENE